MESKQYDETTSRLVSLVKGITVFLLISFMSGYYTFYTVVIDNDSTISQNILTETDGNVLGVKDGISPITLGLDNRSRGEAILTISSTDITEDIYLDLKLDTTGDLEIYQLLCMPQIYCTQETTKEGIHIEIEELDITREDMPVAYVFYNAHTSGDIVIDNSLTNKSIVTASGLDNLISGQRIVLEIK